MQVADDLDENFINESSDRELILVTQLNQDIVKATQAITQIYREYYFPLCRYADNIICDRSESRDIVQNVFLNLWKTRNQFLTVRDVRTYLLACVKNACTSFNRIDRNNRESSVRYFYSGISDTPNDSLSPEIMKIIYEEIGKLPPQQQQIIRHFLMGLKTSAIAGLMSITDKTVRNQKMNAINTLQSKLAKRNLKASNFPFFLLFFA